LHCNVLCHLLKCYRIVQTYEKQFEQKFIDNVVTREHWHHYWKFSKEQKSIKSFNVKSIQYIEERFGVSKENILIVDDSPYVWNMVDIKPKLKQDIMISVPKFINYKENDSIFPFQIIKTIKERFIEEN